MNISSSEIINLSIPLQVEEVRELHVGERVLLSGSVYTARDAAHKRLLQVIDRKERIPFPLEGQVIYYVGPSPTPPDAIIGSAGPTTSSRMDPYTPLLITMGLKGMIGKGHRSHAVRQALVAHSAVYFVTVGGAAALISDHIKAVYPIAYEDLGPEAIKLLEVEDFPLIVANDAHGGDLFEIGRSIYREESNV